VGKVEDRRHILVGQSVEDALTIAAGAHEVAPAQTRQVVRDTRLLQAERLAQLVDALLAATQLLENAQSHRIVQATKPLCEQFQVIDLLTVLYEDFRIGQRVGRSSHRDFSRKARRPERRRHIMTT